MPSLSENIQISELQVPGCDHTVSAIISWATDNEDSIAVLDGLKTVKRL
jgi:hypothetical protein